MILTISSHSLSNYSQCPQKYYLENLCHLKPLNKGNGINRGTVLHQWLKVYYENKIRPKKSKQKLLFNAPFWINKLTQKMSCNRDLALSIFGAFIGYAENWKNETWIPLGTEKGFSKILYENEDDLFILEGRVDLVCMVGSNLLIVDHKGAGSKESLCAFNNQVLAYLWAANAQEFVYNYIVFTKIPQYIRAVHKFTLKQIQDWKDEIIDTCFRIKSDRERNQFTKSYQCQGRGICWYLPICEQTNENVRDDIVRSNFEKEIYRSW